MTVKNNAKTTLKWQLLTNATSFMCNDGEGNLFPTENFEVFVEHWENWVVTKRDSIWITTRSGDVFNIWQRVFGTCVQNDAQIPKVRTNTAHQFEIWDTISLYISEDKINWMMTDIENRVSITDNTYTKKWNTFNGSNDLLELDPNWKVPTGNLPPMNIDIVGLSEDTTGNMDNDYLIKTNWTNKKIKINKYRATDSEALASSTNTKFVTPQGLWVKVADCIGTRVTKTIWTVYQATVNGVVTASSTGASYSTSSNDRLVWYIGSTNNPTTVIAGNYAHQINAQENFISITFAVKKWEYYKVLSNSTSSYTTFSCWFTPIS